MTRHRPSLNVTQNRRPGWRYGTNRRRRQLLKQRGHRNLAATWPGPEEATMNSDIDQVWHQVLAERNGLLVDLVALTEALHRYHDDHHAGVAQWCDAQPCRLLFRPGARREASRLAE
jgi:hypothetical protein